MQDVPDNGDGDRPERIAEMAELADSIDEQLSGEDEDAEDAAVAEDKKPSYRNPRSTNVRNDFALPPPPTSY